MPKQNSYEKLKQNAILTTPKEDLTLMLYDGALKFCNQAVIALENKDFVKISELLLKVQNIVRELQITLNSKHDISKDFSTMYDYIYRQLIDANITKNIDTINEIRDLIREFRDMWKEAVSIAKNQGYSGSN